jgi:hypothetical protein
LRQTKPIEETYRAASRTLPEDDSTEVLRKEERDGGNLGKEKNKKDLMDEFRSEVGRRD